MKGLMRKIMTVGCGIAVATLCACNTVEGIGKDIKKGGESLERAAK